MTNINDKVIEAVLTFVNTHTWDEGHQIIEARRAELLSEAADRVFQELLRQYRDNPKATQILNEHQALLLARCRGGGIDAAFAGLSREPAREVVSPALLEKVLEVDSPQELEKLLKNHPEILSVLTQLMGQGVPPL